MSSNKLTDNQISFFDSYKFPSTRYQGSKNKIISWIRDNLSTIEFDTALDAFGGTGAVSYMLKTMGKSVIYNDIMKFNYYIGKALIENTNEKLTHDDYLSIFSENDGKDYKDIVSKNFNDIYYLEDENKILDIAIQNINSLENEYKKSLAFFCLFQACIAKRPYNLFHRKNLYIRTSEVKRSFGNKKTWDTSFQDHFKKYMNEVNKAVFDNKQRNRAYNNDVFQLELKNVDLVYIDTPYISEKGVASNYLDYYHFLEGMTDYDNWENRINRERKNLPLKNEYSIWTDKREIINGFDRLFNKFKKSILVISYRDNGIPTIEDLTKTLGKYKKEVKSIKLSYKYALSKKESNEVLIIGQ